MNQVKGIIRNFAEYSIGPIGSAVIGFFSMTILTWLIAPAEYGKIGIFQIYLSFGNIIVTLGFDQAFMREFFQIKDKSMLFFNSIILPLVFIAVNTLVLFIFPEFWSQLIFGSPEYVYLIYGTAITLISIFTLRFAYVILRMENRGIVYSIVSLLTNVIIFILNIILLKFWSSSFESIVVANLIANIIVGVIAVVVTKKYWLIKKFQFNKKLFLKLLYFSTPLIPALVINLLFQSLGRLSIVWYSTEEQLGLFQVSMSISMLISVIQQAFTNGWVPIAYRWNTEGAPNKNYEFMGTVLIFLLLFVFFGVMIGREFIVLIIGSSYTPIMTIFPFLTLSYLMPTLAEVTGLGISFARKNSYLMVISIIVLIINFVGNWLLVPSMGAVGATISTGVSFVIFFWLRTIISRKLWYKFPLGKYILFTIAIVIGSIINTFVDRGVAFVINCIIEIVFVIVIILLVRKYKDRLINIRK
ncbi:lipopolysaccharide biosynthesis protein [Culicoidibacter larvae]|uniref:Uncharacterized protein n=1 Tax=Culicoidibacter larvae TaxID=2579976 RepID=A0A5R8QDF8_9FIRM|nr:oligosaccharide flippase family protein [Culicoidibacter larvae]TLG75234.1 hypothetical protein FEZ08_04100 [Culicoidibacter larvae]